MIKNIKVDNLWGERSIDWTLTRNINILSGTNGTGKSTILRSVFQLFQNGCLPSEYLDLFDRISIETKDGIFYSSDTPFDPNTVKGVVYSNLYNDGFEQSDVLSYTSDEHFCNLIDEYFSLTRKTIVRNSSEFKFRLHSGKIISPLLLSSGEKELVKILAISCIATENDVIILDEPENSLHFDWQKTLLESITKSAPKTQVMVSTHSPAMIMNGWIDCVDNIDDITSIFR